VLSFNCKSEEAYRFITAGLLNSGKHIKTLKGRKTMIIFSLLTAAAVITAGTLICSSDEGDYAASAIVKIESAKQVHQQTEPQKLINKPA
jgi:hypothetical protein